MQRVLALDVGDRRIGLAVSDALGITAQGIETYTRTGDLEKDAAYIRSVAFYDERLSTVSAERVLCEAEMNWQKRRKVVDKLAATIILQGYLDGNPKL